MPAAMRPEFKGRLAMLAKVREQRRKVRERELQKRLEALGRAEDALAQQRQVLQTAVTRLDESFHAVSQAKQGEVISGELIGQYHAWIATRRATVVTEKSAADASSAAVEMVRREEVKARDALRHASVAEHKVDVALEQATRELMRAEDAQMDLASDEQNSLRRGARREELT